MRRRKRVVGTGGLEALAKARTAFEKAETQFNREVLFTYEAGSSYRAMGDRIGVPHETLRAIVLKQRRLRANDVARVDRLRGADGSGSGFTAYQRAESLASARSIDKKWRLSTRDPDG
jgi:hypothetical protein